ncbi:MAG: hypothetical protein Q9217_006003, partial [Psora testacea]
LPRDTLALEKFPCPNRKRKRSHETKYPTPEVQQEHTEKRARTSLASCAIVSKEEATSNTDNESGHPINHWIKQGDWPEEYFEPDPNMSQQLCRKKSSSAISYTQSVKEGENPPAYTPEYESEVLAKAGIFMYQHLGQATILDTCKKLCVTLLGGEYELAGHSLFKEEFFWMTLERVRNNNEARVMRDITPSIVPSAELLYIRGASNLQHLGEEMNVEWTKCICIAGPRPKPDYAVGFMSSAFTEDEFAKLKFYTAPGKATLFTGKLYFPFLMCEVKCGENGLNIADRQNAHSASMAVNAIVQLYRDRAVSRAGELHRKILVFSISHDHTMVNIYGHYALIEGDKTTFYRYLIRSFNFTDLDGKDRDLAYKFTRKVYDTFVPIHLKRIRSAIAQLPDPKLESSTSVVSTENTSGRPVSQEIATSAPASQDMVLLKKPRLSATGMLKEQVDQQKQENDRQRQEMNELKEQTKDLMNMLKEQKEENKGLMDILKQRLS